jgi:hypothetical protein
VYLDSQSSIDSYYSLCQQEQIFAATAAVAGVVAYSTATALTGPLLWNGSGSTSNTSRVMAVLLGVSIGWTTAGSNTGVLGIATGIGQTSAPTSTTAITVSGNTFPGGKTSLCTPYNVGTVANAGGMFFGTHMVSATSTGGVADTFVALDGIIQIPPGTWAAVCGAAAYATMAYKATLVWAEIPY